MLTELASHLRFPIAGVSSGAAIVRNKALHVSRALHSGHTTSRVSLTVTADGPSHTRRPQRSHSVIFELVTMRRSGASSGHTTMPFISEPAIAEARLTVQLPYRCRYQRSVKP